jgi:plastocyanin
MDGVVLMAGETFSRLLASVRTSSLQWGSFMLSAFEFRARHVRRSVALALVAAAIAAGAGLPVPVAAATHAVDIDDGFFGPSDLTIVVGDTVTWTNAEDSPHTVSDAAGSFDSGNVDAGQSFSFTFTTPGTYTYVCRYHDEMVATITVVEAGAASSAAPAATSAPPATITGTADHAGGEHGGAQPDTALPAEAGRIPAWVAPLLTGIGLVALAVAVVPSLAVSRSPRAVAPRPQARGGWRR